MASLESYPNVEYPEFLNALNSFSQSWYPYIISFVIAVISGLRMFMAGPRCPSINHITGKVVIITGASSGIGFETAKELASRGGKIIMACRNLEKGQKAVSSILQDIPDAQLDLKKLDVSLISSIREFVSDIKRHYESIDVLINNAGVVFEPQKLTIDGFEVTMATNYIGPFLLTHLLLPLLNNSCNGKVVNLTALAHFSVCLSLDDVDPKCNKYNSQQVFGQTKLAILLFTKHMARLCRSLKVTINAVNPGLVRNTNHFKKLNKNSSFYTRISTFPWMWLFLKNPNQGCQTVVFCAIDTALDTISGAYFSDCEQKDSAPASKNYRFAEELYKKTCELLGINGIKMIKDLEQPL